MSIKLIRKVKRDLQPSDLESYRTFAKLFIQFKT